MSHRTNRERQQQTPRVVRDLREVAEGWRDDGLEAGVEPSEQSPRTAATHGCHRVQPPGGEMVTCKGTWAHAVCLRMTPKMLGHTGGPARWCQCSFSESRMQWS